MESQREVRFTARHPEFYKGLGMAIRTLPPKNFFFYVPGLMTLDTSDKVDGYSGHKSMFDQFDQRIKTISTHGSRQFPIEDLHVASDNGGVELTLELSLDKYSQKLLLVPPFEEHVKDTEHLLAVHTLKNPVNNIEPVIDYLREKIKLGAWVSELTFVSSRPTLARERDMFLNPQLPYVTTSEERDELLGLNTVSTAESPVSEPIILSDEVEKRNPPVQNAS